MPSEQYSLDVLNKSCLELNADDASVVGLKAGQTKVQLIDKSMLFFKVLTLFFLVRQNKLFKKIPHPILKAFYGIEAMK